MARDIAVLFQRCHDKDGQLFCGRYKAVLIDADSHLLEVLRYIHRNPIRTGLGKGLQDYSSSHHGYISTAEKWDWLKKGILLSMQSVAQRLFTWSAITVYHLFFSNN